MNQEEKLYSLSMHDVFLATMAIDDILMECGKNLVLYGAGLVDKTFDQMTEPGDMLRYQKSKQALISSNVVDERALAKDALQLIRMGR